MKPVNRHLLVEIPVKEVNEEKSAFLLPEDYKITEVERYIKVNIVACADDCKQRWSGAAYVENSMIEDISINGELYHIVPENYLVLLLEVE
tara:strand:- start:79 stop:351 length:273 start_codon:yes stop_codon:yes gene_type:complete